MSDARYFNAETRRLTLPAPVPTKKNQIVVDLVLHELLIREVRTAVDSGIRPLGDRIAEANANAVNAQTRAANAELAVAEMMKAMASLLAGIKEITEHTRDNEAAQTARFASFEKRLGRLLPTEVMEKLADSLGERFATQERRIRELESATGVTARSTPPITETP